MNQSFAVLFSYVCHPVVLMDLHLCNDVRNIVPFHRVSQTPQFYIKKQISLTLIGAQIQHSTVKSEQRFFYFSNVEDLVRPSSCHNRPPPAGGSSEQHCGLFVCTIVGVVCLSAHWPRPASGSLQTTAEQHILRRQRPSTEHSQFPCRCEAMATLPHHPGVTHCHS